jgi:hypothetical protein
MSDVFISYARSTEAQALKIAEALRALGYGVWRDGQIGSPGLRRRYPRTVERREGRAGGLDGGGSPVRMGALRSRAGPRRP